MVRMLFLAGAATTAVGSIATVTASPPVQPTPRTITRTSSGQPILLGTMVVTATPLPEGA